jgi:hypothetical protein
MKTSNKLLIAAAIITIFGIIGSAIYSVNQLSENTIKGNGIMITKTIPVSNYYGIAVTNFDFELIKSTENKVEVLADENLHVMFDIKVEKEVLGIGIKPGSYHWNTKLKVKIYYTDLNSIKLSSSASCTGSVTEPTLSVSASSASEADLEINADSVAVSSSSGAKIKVKGKTKALTAKCSSGAKIQASKLISETCEVSASSGADVDVFANQTLDAKASSGGNITYYGNPRADKVKTSSGGNIENGE